MKKLFSTCKGNQNGATIVLMAVSLATLIGFSALAIDVGYMYATRNELQNIADAAALAAATKMGAIYLEQSPKDHATFNMQVHEVVIKAAATSVALENNAGGSNEGISLLDDDILIGKWNWDEGKLDTGSGLVGPTAVQVITRRDSGANGPVETFFANIFSLFGGDHDTFDASAVATAALSGPAVMDEGELNTPFGIAETLFDCDKNITFYPTNESCAGWHNFFDQGGATDFGQTFLNLIMGYRYGEADGITGENWLKDNFTGWWNKTKPDKRPVPEVIAQTTAYQDEYYFSNGTVSTLISSSDDCLEWDDKIYDLENYEADYKDMTSPSGHTAQKKDEPYDEITTQPQAWAALFDFFRFVDGDGNPEVWTATVPVYSVDDGCNPSGLAEIVGYSRLVIKAYDPKKNVIIADVNCDMVVVSALSGGGQFGNVLGSIPNLVQ